MDEGFHTLGEIDVVKGNTVRKHGGHNKCQIWLDRNGLGMYEVGYAEIDLVCTKSSTM